MVKGIPMNTPDILFEDDSILVCIKPAGIPAQPDRTNCMDLLNQLKNHMFQTTKKRPELYVVHRLDRPVGGIMVYAKTQKAASALSKQFQNKTGITKRYLAVVSTCLPVSDAENWTELTDYMKKDAKSNTSRIVNQNEADARLAKLKYRCLKNDEASALSLVEIDLITGRHHQIRLQLKKHLTGILGDRKYNAEDSNRSVPMPSTPALFCYQLSFSHPMTGKKLSFEKYPTDGGFARFF